MSVSSTSDADFNSPPTVIILDDYSVEVVPVTAASLENADVVDKNGNKLEPDESSVAASESSAASDNGGWLPNSVGTGGVLTPVKSDRVTFTPLKQLMTMPASSPSRELVLTPSKQQGSSAKPLTPSRSHSPKLKVVRSKSLRKSSSTPSKSTPTKSPMSSPRQRSLIEMFSHNSAASTSTITAESSSTAAEREPTVELMEDGQNADTSPARQVNVEVLVEDSQMGVMSSPVHVVDTQEPMFVDDTPPHSKASVDHSQLTASGTQSSSDVGNHLTLTQPVVTVDISDYTAADGDGTQLRWACGVTADTCDTGGFPCDDGTQQSIIVRVDVNETVTDATSQLATANVDEVSALAVNVESTSGVQASKPIGRIIIDSDTSHTDYHSDNVTADNMNKMSHDGTSQTEPDVIDHTQVIALDHTQHAGVGHTEVSSVDHTQLTADGTQNSSVDPTQGNYLAATQLTMLDDSQASSKEIDTTAVVTTDGDDVPLSQLIQSLDADSRLTDSHVSKDSAVKIRQMAASSSVKFRRCRRGAGPKTSAKDSKDAIHATIQGRVTRSVTETRPTRLNLRTRSVRRLTDKLVSVGAKKVDGVLAHPAVVRKRGRPRGSKSHRSHGPEVTGSQGDMETRSRVPGHTVRRRHCKSVWMQVAAAETDVAVEIANLKSQAASEVHTVVESCGKPESGINLSQEIVVIGDSKVEGDVEAEELTVCTEEPSNNQRVDEAASVNCGVELATGDVPVTGSSGKPQSGLGLVEEMTVGEVDAFHGEPDTNMSQDMMVSQGDAVEACDKPQSDAISSQEIVVIEDSKVEVSSELTDEEHTSSRPSDPTLSLDVVTKDSHIEEMSTSDTISDNTSASELTADHVAVPDFISAPSDHDMLDVEPAEEVCKSRVEVDKSTPPSDVGADCQWKVPTTSSVTQAHPPPPPPETPTSVPRRRFTSRGSLMLERSMQLRQLATNSPPVHCINLHPKHLQFFV